MEDVYSVKVKSKPDTRNLYPSERRYSASTVSGLAWVHIALAATSFLLACLALVSPNNQQFKRLNLSDVEQKTVDKNEFLYNLTETTTDWNLSDNSTENMVLDAFDPSHNHMLVIAPSLLTVFALAAGLAAIMASVRWYIDHNITWLFIMSLLSTCFSLVAFIMITVWFVNTSPGNENLSEFYKDKVPFKDVFVIKNTEVIDRNESHIVVGKNVTGNTEEITSHLFTKRVLSINILIACFLELLWSMLSVKISYKGMKSNYKDEDTERRGHCISVVTKIKGNDAKKYPRNSKLLTPKPDLIEHYPNKKIKRIFLANGENGFYLKTEGNDKSAKQNTETSSEFYKERMMNFLNRCASSEAVSNPEITPSFHSDPTLNPIPEIIDVEINRQDEENSRMTPSWGDTPDHTIYNQDTINFDQIFKIGANRFQDGEVKESDKQPSE